MRLVPISLAISLAYSAYSQTHTLDKEKGAALLDTAAKEGVELPAKTTVRASVGVTAVLLPQASVRRLFGREISNTYAVVQLTLSNKSPDAAFVLHTAYIDTSEWALGGGTRGFHGDDVRPGDDRESARSGTHPNQLASVESRIVRGQLLDSQQWSARNWAIRVLTVAGSLASGYSFAFKETGIAKGISAFNGTLVPGVGFAWPDGSVAQQNRISDFGYQTNKVVGKQAADVVVCFFPIDMFLSAPLRELFLKSPGLFLSPYQILFSDANKPIRAAMGIADDAKGGSPAPAQSAGSNTVTLAALRNLHACYSKGFEADEIERKPSEDSTTSLNLKQTTQRAIIEDCEHELRNPANREVLKKLNYIGRFGLQNIGVYVDGVMTVDMDTVPASIDRIAFEGDASAPGFWATPGLKKGSIQCRFCSNGQVSITEADKLGLTGVTSIADGSDEQKLNFSFTTTKPIDSGETLTYVITKKPGDPKKSPQDVKSPPFVYTVQYVEVAPSISAVAVEDRKVTVTGGGFFGTKANPLSIVLHSDGKDKDVNVTPPDGQISDKLTFDLPAGLPAGCWNVHVKLGSMETSAANRPDQKVLSEAAPKLTEATRKADSIAVKGEQLVDTSGCGGKAIRFQLVPSAANGAAPKPVDVTFRLNSPAEATLSLPAQAQTGDWTVHILQGNQDVSNTKSH